MKKMLTVLVVAGVVLLRTLVSGVSAQEVFRCDDGDLEKLVGKTIIVKVLEVIDDRFIICHSRKGKALKLKLSGIDVPARINDGELLTKSEKCKSPGLSYLGEKAHDMMSFLVSEKLVIRVVDYDESENTIVAEAKPVRVNTAYMNYGETINEFLVKKGYACATDEKYRPLMLEARKKRLGLWGINLRAMDCFCSTGNTVASSM